DILTTIMLVHGSQDAQSLIAERQLDKRLSGILPVIEQNPQLFAVREKLIAACTPNALPVAKRQHAFFVIEKPTIGRAHEPRATAHRRALFRNAAAELPLPFEM